MRILLLLVGLLLTAASASAGPVVIAYDTAEVARTVQEGLTRLGQDPGPADGAWGKKTRDAMNIVRAANGLPSSDDLTGSSLALIHKLSPGETTLPKPGFFIADMIARRAFLKDASVALVTKACPYQTGEWAAVLDQVKEMPEVPLIKDNSGFTHESDDWSSPIAFGITQTEGQCLAGNDKQCQAIVDLAARWANSDSLQSPVRRKHDQFENLSYLTNVVLRSLIIGYGISRQFVEVPAEEEAVILDWFKRRVDDYHYNQPNIEHLKRVHGLAHMMPALALGILIGDRTMTEPALEVWKITLDQTRDDGSLPFESSRGARWLHYTTLSLSQLVSVAQLMESQGIDVYAMSPGPEKTVQRTFNWLIDAMADFKVALPYAKKNEGSPGDYRIPYYQDYHFGFVPAYQAHFGNDAIMQRLSTATVDPQICSEAATAEEKTQPPTCRAFSGQPISFVKSQLAMGYQPHPDMGYAAGCISSTKAPFSDLGP